MGYKVLNRPAFHQVLIIERTRSYKIAKLIYFIYCHTQNTIMRKSIRLLPLFILLIACHNVQNNATNKDILPIQGTWKLLSGTLIEKGDTVVTDYTKATEFIKIINSTHFAFLSHDMHK